MWWEGRNQGAFGFEQAVQWWFCLWMWGRLGKVFFWEVWNWNLHLDLLVCLRPFRHSVRCQVGSWMYIRIWCLEVWLGDDSLGVFNFEMIFKTTHQNFISAFPVSFPCTCFTPSLTNRSHKVSKMFHSLTLLCVFFPLTSHRRSSSGSSLKGSQKLIHLYCGI